MEQTLLPGRVSSAGMDKKKDPVIGPGLGIGCTGFSSVGLKLGVFITLPHQALASSRGHHPKQFVIPQDNHLRLDSPVGEVYRGGQVVKFKNGFFQDFVVHFLFAPSFSKYTIYHFKCIESQVLLLNKIISNNLTWSGFRVMNTIVIKKEADNDNRKQKPNSGNQISRSVSQTELHLRGGGERGREAALSPTGRPRIQEPVSGGEGHHRTCLRRMDVLEYANRGQCSSTRSRKNRNGNGTHNRNCPECRQELQENRCISSPQPEGCTGRSDSLVLPGLRQELYHFRSRNTGALPGKASGQITYPEKRIALSERAPFQGSSFRYMPTRATKGLTSRGGKW